MNLASFAARLTSRWSSMTVTDWVADLAVTWGFEPHLRVATQMLFAVGHDTFLVRRTESGGGRGRARRLCHLNPAPGVAEHGRQGAPRHQVELPAL